MILENFQSIFLLISGLIFLFSLLVFLLFSLLESKSLINLFKKTPIWFFLLNLSILAYKLFFIPDYIYREPFGIWIIGIAKSNGLLEVLFTPRAPVYFFIINFFSWLFDGVGFVFVTHFNMILFFVSVFYAYWTIRLLTKDRWVAALSGLFYALAIPIFLHSMTEGYTTPALFFAIQALFFIVLYKEKREITFFLIGVASSFLAVGARPEYIIFDVIFLVFLYFFVEKLKIKHYLFYFLAFLPKFFIAFNFYLVAATRDRALIGRTFSYNGNVVNYISKVFFGRLEDFVSNLSDNILALINPFTLMGVFLFFALLILVKWHQVDFRRRKVYFFFLFYLFTFFFYYSFLHMSGVSGEVYKYLASLVFPLSVLAAIGLKSLIGEKDKVYYFIIALFVVYSLWVCTPLINDKKPIFNPSIPEIERHYFSGGILRYIDIDADADKLKAYKEWKNYDSLMPSNFSANLAAAFDFSGDSNKTRGELLSPKENDVLISNGDRSFFYVLPLQGKKIHSVLSEQELTKLLKRINTDTTIYISQGIRGFEKSKTSQYRAMHPKKFENFIDKNLIIEEKLISYYEEDHHVFLYKAKKK